MFTLTLTPEQLKAAAAWCEEGETMADVSMSKNDDGSIHVVQGDDAADIDES